jgi:gamma-glutamyltranspeptidase/glutathione hydrolase
VAALEALLLLEGMEPELANQIHCVMLALEDTYERVRDGSDVADLLSANHLERRRRQHGHPVAVPPGGTVCICAIDEERTAVSFIQSLAGRAGSGVVAPGTGVLLHNRAYAFGLQGQVVPGRRPFHTLIPGLLLQDGELVGPFGVMGGSIQAQAHLQIVSAVVDRGLDPQSALDQPRFRVEGEVVRLEEGLWEQAEALERKGLKVFRDPDMIFGGGQAVMVDGDALLGASDRRQGGYAAGL